MIRKILMPNKNKTFQPSQLGKLTGYIYIDTVAGRVRFWEDKYRFAVTSDLKRFQVFPPKSGWIHTGHYPFGRLLKIQKLTVDLRNKICDAFPSYNPFEILELHLAVDIIFPSDISESQLKKFVLWLEMHLWNKYRRFNKRGDINKINSRYMNVAKKKEIDIYFDKECRLFSYSRCVHIEWRLHGIPEIRNNKLPTYFPWLVARNLWSDDQFCNGLNVDCVEFVKRKLIFLECDLEGLLKEVYSRYGVYMGDHIRKEIYDLETRDYLYNSGRIKNILQKNFHGKVRWADKYFSEISLNIDLIPNLNFKGDEVYDDYF